jgi:tRNA(fMet)-specific endonuclease VapC
MSCYILDSDHVTLHQRRHPVVIQRLAGVPSARVFVSIVTVEEQLRGWLALIRRAPTPERLIAAYTSLHRAVAYFAQVNILDYSDAAANHFAALRAKDSYWHTRLAYCRHDIGHQWHPRHAQPD